MAAPEDPAKGMQRPHRHRTDQSLRTERDKADVGLRERHEAQAADEVVQRARERADKIVQTSRDEADRELEDTQASTQRQRALQDSALGRERTTADALLEREREARRRYLDDFFALEREATDHDLSGERGLADKLIAARDEFLANASHDLRSILGGLAINADLLLRLAPEGVAGQNVRQCASANRRLVAQMNRLVNDLLDVACIHAGKLAMVPEPVEVGRLLRETVEALGPVAAAKGVTLDAELFARPVGPQGSPRPRHRVARREGHRRRPRRQDVGREQARGRQHVPLRAPGGVRPHVRGGVIGEAAVSTRRRRPRRRHRRRRCCRRGAAAAGRRSGS